MSTDKLHTAILDSLRARSAWETRQRLWYEMRHQGLRRRNKPFPGASDLHFPLADGMIEKLKPFYYQQLFATDTIASFVTLKDQPEEVTSAAAQWFDYKLKQESNIEEEMLTCIDHMLMTGRVLLKAYWDAEENRVAFDAIDPLYVIVPRTTKNDIQKADWLAHVFLVSVEQYKANANYKQDADFVKSITGKGEDGGERAKEQEKFRREGITTGTGENEIVIWEVYSRSGAGAGWVINTYSPLRGPDEPIRAEFGLPYEHGLLPFVSFVTEIKDKGYYSPRGIPEIVAAFETSLCKTWNEKIDSMTFANRPIYTADREIPNAGNLRIVPGQIIPYGITAVQQNAPPFSYDQEMTSARMIAEYRVGMPDFGTGQSINTAQRKTATEVEQIGNLMNQNVDLRSRVFRKALGMLYRQSWALLLQYDDDFQYVYDGELTGINPDALHGEYMIAPNGSSDSWNRQAQLQKAVARKQLLGQSPYINQEELDRSILELDDPRLIKRLFVDPGADRARSSGAPGAGDADIGGRLPDFAEAG